MAALQATGTSAAKSGRTCAGSAAFVANTVLTGMSALGSVLRVAGFVESGDDGGSDCENL
jgi:hypothetical protein